MKCLAAVSVLVLAIGTSAAEIVAQARVLVSEPILSGASRSVLADHCRQGKPQDGELSLLLQWDLGIGVCASETSEGEVVGYRVHYEWQGEVLSVVTANAPGDTVPLRVRVE